MLIASYIVLSQSNVCIVHTLKSQRTIVFPKKQKVGTNVLVLFIGVCIGRTNWSNDDSYCTCYLGLV
jgi:hypothetical protein